VNLESFGFTPTEAKVYELLLGLGPSTGYALAKSTRLARANAYQALEGLVRLGAARRSATIPARYAAVPPPQLVAAIEQRFSRDLRGLGEHLRALASAPGEAVNEPSGLLEGDAALLAAATTCAEAAAEELLVVGGPRAGAPLAAAFATARAHGAAVRVLWLGEPAPPEAVVRAVDPAQLRGYWGGEPLAMVADRARAVCGVFLPSAGASGIATTSPGVVPFVRHLLRRELAAGLTPAR